MFENNQHFGHYRILQKIGAGGMGEVYLAEDTKLDRRIALKILPENLANDAERMRRFVQEAKTASALNHPNIITIYEIGEIRSTNFIATEFIEGETLHTRLEGELLNLKSVLEISIQIVSALDAAHRAGIVHRDIKPENVMIRPDGLVKLLDFGIAKLSADSGFGISDSGLNSEKTENPESGIRNPKSEAATAIKLQTNPGIIIGTANYMSPEQARGKKIDARTDIFSFGIVLYEMLAGKPPFTGENAVDTIGSILHQEPPPLNKTAPGIPRELQHIVEKSLRKDRDERYQTARDLLIDLKDLKQELEFQNKLERTSAPNQEETETQTPKATTATASHSTSSAEYVAGEIKNHKVAFTAGIIILLAAVGFGFWYFNKNSTSEPQIDSIAVLPFENASHDPNAEYLSDGISENIINTLSRLPSLRVLPRSTVFRYKGAAIDPQKIGTELNVRAVLTGKIIQRDNILQIQTELIDVASGAQLWGEQYNRPFTDVLNVQETIAREIATNMHLQLTGTDSQQLSKRYTENTGAYQLYLQGRFFSDKRTLQDLQKAIEYFQQAIALDPNYALAFAGLSDAYSQFSTNGASSHDLMTKSREAALKALSLDERLAEGHSALGAVLHGYDFDFAGAEREFKRALELNPNYSLVHQQYGRLLSSLGRHEEAIAELQRALEIDPLSLPVNRIYGEILLFARKYDESIAQFKKTIELDPNFPQTYLSIATAYQIKGMHSEAVEMYVKRQEMEGNREMATLMRESFAKGGWQGFLRLLTGDRRLSTLSPTYLAAVCYVELGEKDKAFAELDKAYENREFRLILLKVDPRLDPLRDDLRFHELLKKVGFS